MRIDRVVYIDFGSWESRMLLVQDEFDFVTLILNARYTMEQRREHLPHELAHVALDHFNDERDIRDLEAEAELVRKMAV